jgi:hypothetical protein
VARLYNDGSFRGRWAAFLANLPEFPRPAAAEPRDRQRKLIKKTTGLMMKASSCWRG